MEWLSVYTYPANAFYMGKCKCKHYLSRIVIWLLAFYLAIFATMSPHSPAGGFSQSFCRDATLPSPLLSSFLPSSPFPSLHAPPPTAVRVIPLSFLPIGGLFTAKSNSHRRAGHDKTVLSVSLPLRWCELDSRQLRTIAGRKCEVWTRSEQSSIQAGTPDIRLSHLPACWPPPPRRGPGRQLRLAARPPQTQRSCRPTPRKM